MLCNLLIFRCVNLLPNKLRSLDKLGGRGAGTFCNSKKLAAAYGDWSWLTETGRGYRPWRALRTGFVRPDPSFGTGVVAAIFILQASALTLRGQSLRGNIVPDSGAFPASRFIGRREGSKHRGTRPIFLQFPFRTHSPRALSARDRAECRRLKDVRYSALYSFYGTAWHSGLNVNCKIAVQLFEQTELLLFRNLRQFLEYYSKIYANSWNVAFFC